MKCLSGFTSWNASIYSLIELIYPVFWLFNVFSMCCRLSVLSGSSFAAVVLWCHRSDDEPERRISVSLAWGGLNAALWALSIFLFASIIASLSHTHKHRFAFQTLGFVIKSTVPEGHFVVCDCVCASCSKTSEVMSCIHVIHLTRGKIAMEFMESEIKRLLFFYLFSLDWLV